MLDQFQQVFGQKRLGEKCVTAKPPRQFDRLVVRLHRNRDNRQHVRRGKKVRAGRRISSQKISIVRAHDRMQKWGAVPARPHVGWSRKGVKKVIDEAVDFFITKPMARGSK